MTGFKQFPTVLIIAGLVAASGLAAAPQQGATSPQTAALSQAIPVDPAITVGTLPNGMRYYVRANQKPEQRAELRLVVKAGSILEDEDQLGLAHFVEHMAFNGTRHFPKQEVVTFMQSIGMRFGAHVNAYTSFDETVYMLQVPTDKPEVLERALLVLEDWAHNVTFDPAEIDKERGVIIEEWRMRRGAGARMTDKMFPILLNGSRYADRLPIGKTEILEGFKPERLKQFYTDWYRPDLMAVVAVGDFDKAAVEALIKKGLGSIPPAAKPRQRPIYDIPDRPRPVYAITSDKEMTSASVEIDGLLPAREQGTVGVYREKMVDRLFSGMLNARFSDLAREPDAPFVMAFVGRGIFLSRTKEQTSLNAMVKEDAIARGLEALVAETERVARFGFTAAELDRQKQAMLRAYERMLAEKENRESGSRAAEYIRNFLEQETLPTNEWEYGLHQRFLPEVTVDEINRRAREWFPERNRLVIVNAPEKAGLTLPNEATLAAAIKAGSTKSLTPYDDAVIEQPLIDPLPAPGTIASSTTLEAAGITEWQLSNGVKVVLKPTTFREDEILFRATSPGGTSLAGDDDYIAATTAVQLITAGGIGRFNATDFRKLMTGKVASARPIIAEFDEGLSGNSSRRDLETMFQLIYLAFTQPRPDPTAFGVQVAQTKTMLANQKAVPEMAFVEALSNTLSQNHVRRRMTTPETVDRWNLDQSVAFYKDRFADASDFTFVFVGSFTPETIKPLVERYLGALPALGRKETWKDVGVRYPTGVIERTIEKGIEPKSQTAIVFTGAFQYDQTQRVAIRALAQVLQSRLLETIREELGGTYSISAVQSYQRFPSPVYSLSIRFGSDPGRAEALVKRVFEELDRLKTNGPTEQQVNEVKQTLLRDFETSSRQNSYLLTQIMFKYQYGEDVDGLWLLPAYYKKLDAAAIQEAARTSLPMGNYVRVTLLPEKK
jgi:zinc protease